MMILQRNGAACRTGIKLSMWLGMMAISGVVVAQSPGRTGTVVKPPSPAMLTEFVYRELNSAGSESPMGILSRGQAKKVFEALKQKGWAATNESEVLAAILPDDDYLVKQLRSAKGDAFLKKIQRYPGGIDRMDRLTRMPQGHANVHALIYKVPNGDEWIQGMTTTRRGERMGDRLSNARTGRDFNEPTGHIYTPESFVQAISGHLEPIRRFPTTSSSGS